MTTGAASVDPRRGWLHPDLLASRKQSIFIGAVPYVILAVLVTWFGILQPQSLTAEQITLSVDQALVLMLVGVGQTFVLLSGGIDLSIAGVMSVANTVAAVYMTTPARTVWVSLLLLALGWIPGLVNGLLIVVFDLQPFIVTLGTWFVTAGIALYVLPTAGNAIVHESFAELINGTTFVIDNTLLLLAGIVVVGMWFLRTRIGAEIRAFGSDPGAARLGGIRVDLAIVTAYSMSSLFATAGGLLLASQSLSGDPTIGDKYLLSSVAAAVIGGTSLFGGSATVIGTVVGALVLGYTARVTFAVGLPSEWGLIFSGLLLAFAVAVQGLVRSLVGRPRDTRSWRDRGRQLRGLPAGMRTAFLGGPARLRGRRPATRPQARRKASIRVASHPAATPGPVRRLLVSHLRRNLSLAIPYIGAAAVLVGGAAFVEGFANRESIDNILALTAILCVVAGSQTLVIIGGGIDLSVPWTMTGAGILTSYLAKTEDTALIWVVPLVLALAVLVGMGNGIGVTVLGIPPIVMTLAMDVILSGAVILYALGASQQTQTPPLLRELTAGEVIGVPAYVLLLMGTVVVFSVILSLTRFGRRLYAVGTSTTVSRLSGVRVRGVVIGSYVLSSMSAALAGMLLLGYVENAFFGMGDPYLFTSISAVVVGGASILGGGGHFIGTLGGALLLTAANALLIVLNLGAGAISIFYGLIILVSVIVLSDRLRGLVQR